MTATKSNVTPERIMQFAWGYSAPLIIEAAIHHKVFDLLAEGPRTVEQISQQSGASVRGLRSIIGALVGLELLAKDGERYQLTPESATFLVSSRPGYYGGFFRHITKQLIPGWLNLTDIVRTGKPARAVNQENTGGEFFQEFVEDIFPLSYAAAGALADALGVAQARETLPVLDLAAGSGVWGISLAQRSPLVRVTAVDWPEVIPVTKKIATRFGLADRYRFVAGDLLEADFGSGHAIATLGHILHSEGEPRSRALLKRVFQALRSGGTIAIQEFLVNDDRTGPPVGLLFAVNMLVNTENGDTYSATEIGQWLKESGFVDVRTLDAPGPSPLVLASKA
ncbi:MAG TPA: methyltransferase [Bryobacteraceae bacterium]|nr:methyltransferase [Bryobacteraceae bacterium]